MQGRTFLVWILIIEMEVVTWPGSTQGPCSFLSEHNVFICIYLSPDNNLRQKTYSVDDVRLWQLSEPLSLPSAALETVERSPIERLASPRVDRVASPSISICSSSSSVSVSLPRFGLSPSSNSPFQNLANRPLDLRKCRLQFCHKLCNV